MVDSDYAGDMEDRKSRKGAVVMYGGAPVAWMSQKQKCVALSSTEAEYVATGEGVKMLLMVRNLCEFLLDTKSKLPPTPLFMDNKAGIDWIQGEDINKRAKHIDVKYHFIKDREGLDMATSWIPTGDNIADILTKPLMRVKFEGFRGALGLCS